MSTPGCASFEIRTPHPQHPPLAELTYNLHKPAAEHRSPDSVRVWVRVRVRVGWLASGATA